MSHSGTAQIQLLLDALRPDQTPDAWASHLRTARADWDDLAVRAIVFGLAPQLHRRLSNWALAPPPRAAAKLTVTYEAHTRRNTAIFEQLGEVLAACAARGLRPVVLKGAHLAAEVYPEPALRPMNDIDLLFAPDELPAAEAVLEELGYGVRRKSPNLGARVTKHTSTARRPDAAGATPNPYLSAETSRTIEPHISLAESWYGLRVDITPGVRKRVVLTELGGHPAHVLARADLLLHVAVHFVFHLIMGYPSLVQLTDLLMLTHTDDMPWADFVRRSGERQATPYGFAALHLAQKLVGAEFPADVRSELGSTVPGPLRRYVENLGLEYVIRRTQQTPATTLGQRVRRGISDRAEVARWAPDWLGRWEVWKTALLVTRTDTGRLLLGRSGNDA
jgi:hypothetical protein